MTYADKQDSHQALHLYTNHLHNTTKLNKRSSNNENRQEKCVK